MNKQYAFRLSTTTFMVVLFSNVSAQGWFVDEVSKENDGGLFVGILGFCMLLGIIWVISHIFERDEKSKGNSDIIDNHEIPYKDEYDDVDIESKLLEEQSNFINNNSQESNVILLQGKDSLNGNSQDNYLDIDDYNKKCIEIYGKFVMKSNKLLIIKEDGEYKQISYLDRRFQILSDYITKYGIKNSNDTFNKGNERELSFFIESEKKYKVFPEAKPMEEHGCLEKEFFGEQIMIMMSYYSMVTQSYRLYTTQGPSVNEYCLTLGLDLAVYIHKYIKQPMDFTIYYDLMNMKLRNMTKEEYLKYKKLSNAITQKDGYYFDGFGNKLGSSFDEAKEALDSKELFSFEDAITEVKKIKWN